jgi:hypothetical protein
MRMKRRSPLSKRTLWGNHVVSMDEGYFEWGEVRAEIWAARWPSPARQKSSHVELETCGTKMIRSWAILGVCARGLSVM